MSLQSLDKFERNAKGDSYLIRKYGLLLFLHS